MCHRRFGKTVLAINHIIDRALRNERERPRYAYIAPLYRQAKQTAWDYLKAYTRPIPGTEIRESELRVDLPGERRIQLFGADNPDALRGIYLDGVVLDEYAQMPRALWAEVIRPALADREGWAIFIGTPAGRNAFCELYEDAQQDGTWHAAMYKASETGVLPKLELDAARKAMSEDQYAQEFECSFEAALPGAYYGRLMREATDAGRITRVPFDPAVAVETWWDLGIGDATAIWFAQRVGQEVHLIDYYENDSEGLAHYASVLQQKQNEHAWVYDVHVMPHDSRARELGTGQSRQDILEGLGIRPLHIMPREDVGERIEAARVLIPRCWFDADRCARGIEALRQYHQEWDDKRQVFRNRPFHDWTSHGADAFGEGAKYRPSRGNWQAPIKYPKSHISRSVI